MTPFLHQVAHHYLNAQGLEDYCFVFPNRRSGQFFSHYLQQEIVAADARSPHLMPCVTSINDLVAELTATTAATDIEMMFALYDAYCQAMGDKAQEFDKFIYWAQLIVSDFNDIDRSLADAGEIYRNLDDVHNLSSNYITPEVEKQVKRIFGENLFTAFFDTSAEADLWQHRTKNSADETDQQKDSTKASAPSDDKVKHEFISLWNALETIYNSYHDALAAKHIMSPGRQLRKAAEEANCDAVKYSRVVFVGFGVLSAAEVKIFDNFKLSGKADFWWDNAGLPALLDKAPRDPGALLIKGYCNRFGAKPIAGLEDIDQSLRVVAVPSNVGQAKQAFNEVLLMKQAQQTTASPGIETAIVLPDEGLLVPLLHSIHDVSRVNVTLGYPLRSSGIVSLMHIVARMHHQASKERGGVWTYYREDVNDILSHPLIKTYFTSEALALTTELARTNRFRVPASELMETSFGSLFTPALDSDRQIDERVGQVDYLDQLLTFCNLLMDKMNAAVQDIDDDLDEPDRDGGDVPLQQAFLLMYTDVLNQLKRVLAECNQSIQRNTVFYLIDRLTAAAIVPFTGEPLQGLQIMGLLETRSLDFENVVILSMNERVFPRRRSINSFIPNYIRRAHGMSTIEQQEAIVAYNFYRLLNRARRVTLIYDSSAQKIGSAEPSRYITQLEKVYGKTLYHVEMTPEVETSSAITIEVPSTLSGDLRDLYTRDPENARGKNLSASAINKFITCPLQFYLHYVQGLNDDNETSDFMDSGTFGTIIHDTLSDCYDNEAVHDRNGLIDSQYLEFFKKEQLEGAVIRNIKKTYLHVPEDQLLTDDQPLRGEAYMLKDTIRSFVCFVIDYDIELINDKGPITVLECEKSHNMPAMKMGDECFNFTYKPDRIDRQADGTVRIVDYKTGRDETTFIYNDKDGLKQLFERDMDKRRKAILQLFLYSYAYLKEFPEVGSVMPVIYKLTSMKDSGVKWKSQSRGRLQQCIFSMNDPMAQEFISEMAATIKSLYDGAFVQAPENPKSRCCNYCRFIDFCRRAASRANY